MRNKRESLLCLAIGQEITGSLFPISLYFPISLVLLASILTSKHCNYRSNWKVNIYFMYCCPSIVFCYIKLPWFSWWWHFYLKLKLFNPFHIDTFWRLCSRWLFENIVTKKEIAQNEQFLLLQQCFPLLVIGNPFNYRDFPCFVKICSKSSAAELSYEGKG